MRIDLHLTPAEFDALLTLITQERDFEPNTDPHLDSIWLKVTEINKRLQFARRLAERGIGARD